MTTEVSTIYDDPTIKQLLSRMPDSVAQSFREEQLSHLLTAIGARRWGKHPVDLRGTFSIPFYRWRFYYVMLAGKNLRELSRKEQQSSLLILSVISTVFIGLCIALGLLALYLLKSAAGINLFPEFSFGVWDWFKGLWA